MSLALVRALFKSFPWLPSLDFIVHTQCGPAVLIMSQYANFGKKGHTIHLASQLHAFGTLVHEAPRSNGGLQRLITPDGYHIPLSYRSGLPYMDTMHPPSEIEMDTLPHIILTGDDVWNPACVDDEFSIDALKLDSPADHGDQYPNVNDIGEYTGNIDEDIDLIIHQCRTERQEREICDDMPDLLERCIHPSAPILKRFVPTSVGCQSSESRRPSKRLHNSQGMLLVIPFANTVALTGLLPMSIVGTKMSPPIRSSQTPLLMMMASLAILDAPWHRYMLASIAPNALPME